MNKALVAGLAVALFLTSGLTTFWLLEPDPWIAGLKIVTVVRQLEGETTAIDVPTEPFAAALKRDFTIQTLVRTRKGSLLESTAALAYMPNTEYRFVTPRSLSSGSYEAQVRVGYNLNPLSYREQEFPLALIYVYPKEKK